MANGLFTGTSLPVLEARSRARLIEQENQRQQQVLNQLLQGAGSPQERLGLAIGSAFGQGLGEGLFTGQVDEQVQADPELIAARENVALAQQMQALTEGEGAVEPGTADFFTQAARLASENQRPDLALQLASQATEARRQEQALVAKTARQAGEQRRAEFNQLPADAKLAALSEDETLLDDILPRATPEEREAVREEIRATVETRRLKNIADLANVRPAKVTQPRNKDINQVGVLLEDVGLGADSFRKWFGIAKDSDAFQQFAVSMTDQVLAEQDAAARQGQRLSRRQILQDIRSDLAARGALQLDSDGDVIGVDTTVLNRVLEDRLSADPNEAPGEGEPRRREGVIDL